MINLEIKLVEKKLITAEQFKQAQKEAAVVNRTFWMGLVRLGYLSEEDICLFFAGESGIPYVDISAYNINIELLTLLDQDYCMQNLVIPLFKVKNSLFVACSNPFNTGVIDALTKMCGYAIEPLIASGHSIQNALDFYCRMDDKFFEAGSFMIKTNAVKRIGFWRESERIALKISVNINPQDNLVLVRSLAPIVGQTLNISVIGTSLAVSIPIFLPQGLKVSIEFIVSNSGNQLTVLGEIVHSYMDNTKQYILGVRFIDIKDAVRSSLLRLADAGQAK